MSIETTSELYGRRLYRDLQALIRNSEVYISKEYAPDQALGRVLKMTGFFPDRQDSTLSMMFCMVRTGRRRRPHLGDAMIISCAKGAGCEIDAEFVYMESDDEEQVVYGSSFDMAFVDKNGGIIYADREK